LVDSLVALAELGDDPEANFGRALQLLQQLEQDGRLPDRQKPWIALIKSALSELWARKGRGAYHAGEIDTAVEHLTKAVEMSPMGAYFVLWAHMARVRAGKPKLNELRTNAARLDRQQWPALIAFVWLGEAPDSAAHIEAKAADNEQVRTERLCEADFYVGLLHVWRGDQHTGRTMLRQAEAKCPPNYVEYEGARNELRRLDLAHAPPDQQP
jgi:lipoprotein NlpI